MKVKVYGEPNKHAKVRVMNPVSHKKVLKRLFVFDENGEAIVDTTKLKTRYAKELLKRYKHRCIDDTETSVEVITEAEVSEVDDEPKAVVETKLRHCKKCDFTCDNQGDLMRHYRESHSKT